VNTENTVAYAASRGIELRHPLHDFRLTQFLIGAAGGVLRRNGVKKHLLREAMRGTLPEVVRERRSKADMSPPIIDGVTARLETRPLRDLHCVKRGWVDAEVLETHQAKHLAWRQAGSVDAVPSVPYAPVWNAIAIDLWLEHAVGL
jgi:asparagine synthase (glutamine-hydrolysing)